MTVNPLLALLLGQIAQQAQQQAQQMQATATPAGLTQNPGAQATQIPQSLLQGAYQPPAYTQFPPSFSPNQSPEDAISRLMTTKQIEGESDERQGRIDQYKMNEAATQSKFAELQNDFRKATAPAEIAAGASMAMKEVDFAIEKLKAAEREAKTDVEREVKLKEAYIRGRADILRSDSSTKEKDLAAFDSSFDQLLGRGNAAPSPIDMKISSLVDDLRKQGKSDNQIEEIIVLESKKYPHQMVAPLAQRALNYLRGGNAGPAIPQKPSVQGFGSAPQAGSPVTMPAKPEAKKAPGSSVQITPEEMQSIQTMRSLLKNYIAAPAQKGGQLANQGIDAVKQNIKQNLDSLGWASEKVAKYMELLFA